VWRIARANGQSTFRAGSAIFERGKGFPRNGGLTLAVFNSRTTLHSGRGQRTAVPENLLRTLLQHFRIGVADAERDECPDIAKDGRCTGS